MMMMLARWEWERVPAGRARRARRVGRREGAMAVVVVGWCPVRKGWGFGEMLRVVFCGVGWPLLMVLDAIGNRTRE